MPEFVVEPHAIEPVPLRRLREAILASPYVGDSPLAGGFDVSRGFGLTFRREGVAELEQRFAFLVPFLQLVLGTEPVRRLRPWPWRRLPVLAAALPNAFYLNLLLIGPEAGVGLHLDGTLRQDSGVPNATPKLVSVLYLQSPEEDGMSGGELRLFRNWQPVGSIQPAPGMLVHFRGDLKHEVRPFRGVAAGSLRASLVCEQYRFPAGALDRIPALAVHSRNGFRAFLQERGQHWREG